MKLQFVLFIVMALCFSACGPTDNDKPSGPDVEDCTQQESSSEPFLTMEAHEIEPDKTDTIGWTTSEVTIVQQYFPGDANQLYIDVIHALLDDRYSVIIKLTRSLLEGMEEVSYSSEVTISTTDAAQEPVKRSMEIYISDLQEGKTTIS